MGINVGWANDQKTVIRQDYGLHWQWDEYLSAFEETYRLANDVHHRVGIIAEIANLKSVPSNAIMYGSRAVRNLPPHVVLCVVVTPSQLAISLLKAIQAITRFDKVVFAQTVEEAWTLLEAALKEDP